MINFEALSKISYGLYLVCSGDKDHGNGFIANTVFQVTAEPAQFATCCNKDNFSCNIIEKNGHFSVSILHQNTTADMYGKFGYRSGKDFNKLEGLDVKYGISGVPVVLNDSVAYLECKVVQKVDLGTHIMFIGELLDAQLLDNSIDPITYDYYRKIKKGVAPKNAPTYIDKSKLEKTVETTKLKTYKCTVCGHIYDENEEEILFSDLAGNWICPVCGVEKEDFTEI